MEGGGPATFSLSEVTCHSLTLAPYAYDSAVKINSVALVGAGLFDVCVFAQCCGGTGGPQAVCLLNVSVFWVIKSSSISVDGNLFLSLLLVKSIIYI